MLSLLYRQFVVEVDPNKHLILDLNAAASRHFGVFAGDPCSWLLKKAAIPQVVGTLRYIKRYQPHEVSVWGTVLLHRREETQAELLILPHTNKTGIRSLLVKVRIRRRLVQEVAAMLVLVVHVALTHSLSAVHALWGRK